MRKLSRTLAVIALLAIAMARTGATDPVPADFLAGKQAGQSEVELASTSDWIKQTAAQLWVWLFGTAGDTAGACDDCGNAAVGVR